MRYSLNIKLLLTLPEGSIETFVPGINLPEDLSREV